MPNPGSHRYDIERTRLRGRLDDEGVPDQHADEAANAQLQQDNPPRTLGDPDRAAGPLGAPTNPDVSELSTPKDGQPQLRSAAFNDHTLIRNRYSYDGGNTSLFGR